MTTTLDIPDRPNLSPAKSKAAEQGIALRQFVTEAVEDKVKATPPAGARPWMTHMGRGEGSPQGNAAN